MDGARDVALLTLDERLLLIGAESGRALVITGLAAGPHADLLDAGFLSLERLSAHGALLSLTQRGEAAARVLRRSFAADAANATLRG